MATYWDVLKKSFESRDAFPLYGVEDYSILIGDQYRMDQSAKYGRNKDLLYYPDSVSDIRVFTAPPTEKGADRYFLGVQKALWGKQNLPTFVVFRQAQGSGPWKAVHRTYAWDVKDLTDPFPATGGPLETAPAPNPRCGEFLEVLNYKRTPDPGAWAPNIDTVRQSRIAVLNEKYIRALGGQIYLKTAPTADPVGPTWILPDRTQYAPCLFASEYTTDPTEKHCYTWAPWSSDEMLHGKYVWSKYGMSWGSEHFMLNITPAGVAGVKTWRSTQAGIRSDECPKSMQHDDSLGKY
ncbi:hypothetical protein [Embleya sp. NPDC005575]|uniref:hypothetical protein n=1 Tax=Embleya sp. NPDC005575 TaxID=3156892 RepID=UPI0033B85CDD